MSVRTGFGTLLTAYGRHGQAELFTYVLRIIVIALLAFLLAVQVGFFTGAQTSTEELEAKLVATRFVTGPSGFSAREPETGRVLPSVIDVNRFTEKVALDAYNEGFDDKNFWGGRFTLYETYADRTVQKPFRSFLWPRDGSGGPASYLPLAQANVDGPGGGIDFTFTYSVLIMTTADEPPKPGWLVIELVKRT